MQSIAESGTAFEGGVCQAQARRYILGSNARRIHAQIFLNGQPDLFLEPLR